MHLAVRPAPLYTGADFFEEQELPLRVIHVDCSPAFPRHRHEFNELVIVCSGAARHIIDGNEYDARKGDVFFIPKDSRHEYAGVQEFCYINVIFDDSLWADSDESASAFQPVRFPSGCRFKLSPFGEREAVVIINRIDQELFNRHAHYALMAAAYFTQLWVTLSRRRSRAGAIGESAEARVRRVIDALERECGQPVSVADMAAEAGMCVRNFHRLFKSLVGCPPLVHINRLRIEKAADLLRETDKTVTQIASLVGYDDGNYFTRQFKNFYGYPPRKYREQA